MLGFSEKEKENPGDEGSACCGGPGNIGEEPPRPGAALSDYIQMKGGNKEELQYTPVCVC